MGERWRVMLMSRNLDTGGTERQLAETARFLDRSRFEPHVGCMRASGVRLKELETAGIPIAEFPIQSFYSARSLAPGCSLGRYLEQHRIQLVHTFDTPMNLVGVPLAKIFRTPAVLSSQRGHRSLMPKKSHWLLRVTDHMVDGIVVNCEAMRRHLIEEERVARGAIHLCHNGIDIETFHPRAMPRPPALEGASLVIGVICVLRPEKGLNTLIEAFARVRHLCPGSRLLIVGSGPVREELMALCSRLGLEETCTLVPATDKVPDWLAAIDIFVLPSLSEALSNSLMEAMACGCCPVASRVGGNPELVFPEQTGLLFRPGDAEDLAANLRRLLEDPPLRKWMSGAAVRLIQEKFSVHAAVRRMEEIYRQFLDPLTES